MNKQILELESILKDLAASHERLLVLLRSKRAALRQADRERVIDLCAEENQQVHTISGLEQRRLKLVADLTLALEPDAPQPLNLEALARRLPEPACGRLLVLRSRLREKMEQARREAGATRQATERLVQHIQGLIQTVGGMMAGVATYAPSRPNATEKMNFRTFSTTG